MSLGMQMAHSSRKRSAACIVVSLVLVSAAGSAVASGSCLAASSGAAADSHVNAAIANFGSRVVAIGRVDSVSRGTGVEVLGIRVMPSTSDSFQTGDYALIVDWSRRGSKEQLLEVRPVSGRYIPGVSEIFLKSKLSANNNLLAQARVGAVNVDFSSSPFVNLDAAPGAKVSVRGTQPQPNGVVIGSCFSIARDGSLGTGRLGGSLGTGKTDGSLGT